MKDLFGNEVPEPTLYDFSVFNEEKVIAYFRNEYDKHNGGGTDMLKRVHITRRVLSVLALHPDWNEEEVFTKVQHSFRKGGGTDIQKKIDRELYNYFKAHYLEHIILDTIEPGHEYDYYAHHSNDKLTKEQWVAKARAKWGDAYDYTDSVYIAGLKPITIRCIKHDYPFTVQAGNHICTSNKRNPYMGGCPICSQERLALIRRPSEVVQKEREERQARQAERERKREEKRLEKERKKAEREAQIAAQKAERERQKQLQAEERKRKEEERIRKRTADLISQAIEIHGNKYDYTKTTYEKKLYHGKMMWVLANIKCPTHGYFDARPDVHVTMKCGCPACAGNYNFVPVEERKAHWVARCQKKYGDRFDYSQFNYVDNDTKGIIICREHNFAYEQTPWSHLRNAGGCPVCNGSEGEVHIRTWLENHNINFIPQYQIPNENIFCKRQYLVPDFWVPDYNLFIEMNGQQHYKYIAHFHDGREHWTFEDQQIRDETLRTYCKEHKHNLLEIKYDQMKQIPKILERAIKKYAR